MAEPSEQPGQGGPDQVDLSEVERQMHRADPNAETDVIPADQLVRPGEREIPRGPAVQTPTGTRSPARGRDFGYDSPLRAITLLAIAAVILTAACVGFYILWKY